MNPLSLNSKWIKSESWIGYNMEMYALSLHLLDKEYKETGFFSLNIICVVYHTDYIMSNRMEWIFENEKLILAVTIALFHIQIVKKMVHNSSVAVCHWTYYYCWQNWDKYFWSIS